MWPMVVILGGLLLWRARKPASVAPPGYERISSVTVDAQASELLNAFEASGQQTLALGDYMVRWEFEKGADGRVRRVAALYRKTGP